MKRGLIAIGAILHSHDRILSPYQVLLALLQKHFRIVKANSIFAELHKQHNLLMSEIIQELCVVVPAFDQCELLIIQNLNKMLPLVCGIPAFAGLIRGYLEVYPYLIPEIDNAIIAELVPQPYGLGKRNYKTADDVLEAAQQVVPALSIMKRKSFSIKALENIGSFAEDADNLAFPEAIRQGLTLRFTQLKEENKLLFILAITDLMVDFEGTLLALRVMFAACFPHLNDISKTVVLNKLIELAVKKQVHAVEIAQYIGDVFNDIVWELKREVIQSVLSKSFTNDEILIILEVCADKMDSFLQCGAVETLLEGVSDKDTKPNLLNVLVKVFCAFLVALPEYYYEPILQLFNSGDKAIKNAMAIIMSEDFTSYTATKRGVIYATLLTHFDSIVEVNRPTLILNLNANLAHIPEYLKPRCLTLLFSLLPNEHAKIAGNAYKKILNLVETEPAIFKDEILKDLLHILSDKELVRYPYHIPLLKTLNGLLSGQDRIKLIEKFLKMRPHQVSTWWKDVEPVVIIYVAALSLQVPAEKALLDKLTGLWLYDHAIDGVTILAPHIENIPQAQVKLKENIPYLITKLSSKDYSESLLAMENMIAYLEFMKSDWLEEIFIAAKVLLNAVEAYNQIDVIQFIAQIGNYAKPELNQKICQFLLRTLNNQVSSGLPETCRYWLKDLLVGQSNSLQIQYLQHLLVLAEKGDKDEAWFLFHRFVDAEPKLLHTAAKEVLQMVKFGIANMTNEISIHFNESKLKNYFLPYLLIEFHSNKNLSPHVKQLVENLSTEILSNLAKNTLPQRLTA